MKMLHRSPFRCRSCQNRFYVYVAPERDEAAEILHAEVPASAEPKAEVTRNPDVP
jgi:hypothetical protein